MPIIIVKTPTIPEPCEYLFPSEGHASQRYVVRYAAHVFGDASLGDGFLQGVFGGVPGRDNAPMLNWHFAIYNKLDLTEPMLSKPELSSILAAHADNLRLANIIRVLARSSDLASEFGAVVGTNRAKAFGPSLALLKSSDKVVHVADQMYFVVVRTAVTDGMELTRDYCRRTEQVPILKAQPWFQVFRLIRNALNHNFHFAFGVEDRAVLPKTWRNITISLDLEGTELTRDILPPAAAIEWLEELDAFIEKELR